MNVNQQNVNQQFQSSVYNNQIVLKNNPKFYFDFESLQNAQYNDNFNTYNKFIIKLKYNYFQLYEFINLLFDETFYCENIVLYDIRFTPSQTMNSFKTEAVFIKELIDCINFSDQQDFIITSLSLKYNDGGSDHSNLLIINPVNKTFEIFEPGGSSLKMDIIRQDNHFLGSFFQEIFHKYNLNFRYVNIYEEPGCPNILPQQRFDDDTFCFWWSILYGLLRISQNHLTSSQILQFMTNDIRSKLINLQYQLSKLVDKYLDSIYEDILPEVSTIKNKTLIENNIEVYIYKFNRYVRGQRPTYQFITELLPFRRDYTDDELQTLKKYKYVYFP